MDVLNTSTLLYVTQSRQENLDKLIGHRFSEALSWRNSFKKVIILFYSSTNNYLFKKIFNNAYMIGVPFDLSPSTLRSIFNLGRNYLNLSLFLFKLTKKIKIDIIRLENLVISGPSVFLISKIKKIPQVLWLGGYERKAIFAKYKKNLLTWFITKFITLFETLILRNVNFIYPVSDELLEIVKKRNVKNYFLSPNYVDLSVFIDNHRDDIFSKEIISLLYVGRFEEEKGIKILLRAIKILSKKNLKFELILVGDGVLKEWIINFTELYKIKNVRMLGLIDYKDMPNIYNMADIFVLPSLTEGSPGSIIEAMGCGTAIICTAVGECPKIIKNGQNGLIVEPGKPQIFADAILDLMNNRHLINKFKKTGRISAINRTKNYMKLHKFVYEKILKNVKFKNLKAKN